MKRAGLCGVDGLLYIKRKTDRAKFHLDELRGHLRSFIDDDPYRITSKDDLKKSRHIVRFYLKPIPKNIPMEIGEFAYCLRSGLDQLAWQLAMLNVKGRPHQATAFPILDSNTTKSRESLMSKTRDISPAAREVIDSLQPHNRGAAHKDHPLWILGELCTVDKHRILPVNSIATEYRITGVSEWLRRELKYGIVVSVPLAEKSKLKLNPKMSEIIFGEPIDMPGSGLEVRVATLVAIHKFVRDDVIPRFAGFFK